MESPAAVVDMLTTLLGQVDAAARLTECTRTPDGRWYVLRVDLPDAIAKSLTLPASLIHWALAQTDAEARETLQRLLRTAIRVERSREAIYQSRETLAGIE
jgi:hypothetical protein